MKMLAEDREALQGALREVSARGAACAQQPDTQAIREALDAVWSAVRAAREMIPDIERRAFETAQPQPEQRSAQG